MFRVVKKTIRTSEKLKTFSLSVIFNEMSILYDINSSKHNMNYKYLVLIPKIFHEQFEMEPISPI